MPTACPPHNDAVFTPPTPCPRCSKTHPKLLPRPSKGTKNSANTLELHLNHSEQSIHRIPVPMHPPAKRKVPLLPTPPAPARPDKKNLFQDHPHTVTVITNNIFQDHIV